MQQQGRQSRPPNTGYRTKFGRRLRETREARGVSQEDLANITEMSRRYVGSIERGEVSPTLDRIVNIAFALGVEPADLLPPSGKRHAPRE